MFRGTPRNPVLTRRVRNIVLCTLCLWLGSLWLADPAHAGTVQNSIGVTAMVSACRVASPADAGQLSTRANVSCPPGTGYQVEIAPPMSARSTSTGGGLSAVCETGCDVQVVTIAY